ncbi:MAG TPA: hypothetical protein VK824_03305 [Planctomycetota bacterium]|nr:hypothetical protein [Planctomycetota bacterium]
MTDGDDQPGGATSGAPAGAAGAAGASASEGAARVPAPTESGRHPLAAVGGELVALSSEARLATALLLQAQALEGMRQAHGDLQRRLDDGARDGSGARRTVDELQAALREVQEGQRAALGQLARARRRASRRAALLAGALIVATLGLAWVVQSSREQLGREIESVRAAAGAPAAAAAADGGGTEALLREELRRAGAERDDARAELARRSEALTALHAELAGRSELVVAAQAELASAQRKQDDLQQQLVKTRDDRNRQIGEAGRLREQVADRDRQLTQFAETMNGLRADLDARKAAPAGRIVTATGEPGALPVRVTAALHGSGAESASVLESGPVADGALTDVLVLFAGAPGGSSRVVRAGRASLLVEQGRALLRLEHVVSPQGGQPAASEDIVLPALQADAWRALGLAVPAGFVPIPAIAAALGELLGPHGYRVVHLDSFDGVSLGGLELRQEDSRGELLRTLTAARAEVLPVGPELALQDGSIRVGDDVRPFFRGECRVPLPGADFGAWLASVTAEER